MEVIRKRAALIVLFIGVHFLLSTAPGNGRGGDGYRTYTASEFFRPVDTVGMSDAGEYGKSIWLTLSEKVYPELRSGGLIRITDFMLPSGESVDIELREFRLFSPGAIFVTATNGGTVPALKPAMAFYRGKMVGALLSFVYLAVGRDNLWGTVTWKGTEYSLFTRTDESFTASRQILQISEVIPGNQQSACGVTEMDEQKVNSPQPARVGGRILVDTLLAEVAIDADYEAFLHYGGISQTQDYVSARMGEVSAIYELDMAIKLEISYFRVWTDSNDPYNSGSMSAVLSEFTNYWKANMDTVDRDLAVLASRRALDGFSDGVTAGVAALDALCNKNRGYAFDRLSGNNGFISGNTGVMAHEIGHVFGSRHTHSCWWNPPVDSCVGPEDGNCYTQTRPVNGEIMSYCGQKTNEFRERVAPYVRQRAEAAPCLSISSQIRSISLDAPGPGDAPCAASSLDIEWISTGVRYVKIELSSDGGGTFPTVLNASTSAISKVWTWAIPPNQPSGTQYRIRISDAQVGSPVAVMTGNFQIRPLTAISQHPVGKTVCMGNNYALNVSASGAAPLAYQWKRNGTDIPGATGSTLQVNNASKQDSGMFTCTVTGACGSLTSNPALVTVNQGAVIIRQPQDVVGCEGKPARISVEMTGDNLSYRWYVGTTEIPGATTGTLTIANVKLSDQGAYFCQISSPCGGTMTNTAYLTVGTPSLSLSAPSGGEEYAVGDSLEIRWIATCVDSVKLEYSSDGGTTWVVVAADQEGSIGMYRWKLPSNPTDRAKIRISDMKTGSIVSQSNQFIIKVSVSVDETSEPGELVLAQNYPNPFRTRTVIRVSLLQTDARGSRSTPTLKVYDLLGREILDLSEEARRSAEVVVHRAQLPVPGVYVYRLEDGRRSLTRTMILLH